MVILKKYILRTTLLKPITAKTTEHTTAMITAVNILNKSIAPPSVNSFFKIKYHQKRYSLNTNHIKMKKLYKIGLYIELPKYNTPISCICQGVRKGKVINIYKIVTNT